MKVLWYLLPLVAIAAFAGGMVIERSLVRADDAAARSSKLQLASDTVVFLGEYYAEHRRYPGSLGDIPRSELKYRDGATPRMVDEMAYHCDESGQRVMAVLGDRRYVVRMSGDRDTEDFDSWMHSGP